MRRTRRPANVPPQDMAKGRVLQLTGKVWLTVPLQRPGSQAAQPQQETRILADYRGTRLRGKESLATWLRHSLQIEEWPYDLDELEEMMGNIQWYMWEGLNKVILRLPTATITMSHLTELAWGYSISAASIDAVGEMLNDAGTRTLVFTTRDAAELVIHGNRTNQNPNWRLWDAFCFPLEQTAKKQPLAACGCRPDHCQSVLPGHG